MCDLFSDLEGQCTHYMICSSRLEILNPLLSKRPWIFILLWVLQIMKPMVPSCFSTLPAAMEGSAVLSSRCVFHLEGCEWYAHSQCVTPTTPEDMFWMSILQLYQNDILAADGEGIYANNFIPNTCFYYFLRHILLVHTSWLKNTNHKQSHVVLYHTKKHTHMHTSAVNSGCSDPDTVRSLPPC